ncbi:PQQ-dependent sugar dehydrogenase [Stutzerimonas tarimensis]|uniref:PQQ-dependent sugar dehydrogenase n=1 Tax=Stutzerimonas tarimensis TaxID=1507735 RepID=A0ABV7T6I5_9GAMM
MHLHFKPLGLAAAIALAFSPAIHADDDDSSATPPSSVSTSAGQVNVETLATLEYPWAMAYLPDGRLLVTEKPGRMRIWSEGSLSDPLQGVPEVVYRGTEQEQGGLLDVEVDPDFASNNLIYLTYAEAAQGQSEALEDSGDARLLSPDKSDNIVRGGVVARARLDGNTLHDLEIIWRQDPMTVGRGHFGNRLNFDADGMLFVTSGDRMRFEPAQSKESNLGKVVRINKDGSIPDDNPFADEDDAKGEIWSYGHRNILAAAFDRDTGNFWAFEMGPLGGDEVNLVKRGENYGWPEVSDGSHYANQPIPSHAGDDEYEKPVRSWTPVVSPSGAHWYDGELFSGWSGSMLVGGLTSKGLVRLTFNGEKIAMEERIVLDQRIRDVIQAPDGAILVIVDQEEGGLLRLTPAQ